jgi:hypothetical protein
MKQFPFLMFLILICYCEAFSQASSVENLKRTSAKEIGNNTRTEDVSVSNIKRKMTSVSWYAQANGICYECDADDMVRSLHIVKVDCSLVPTDSKATGGANNKKESSGGPKDPLGHAIYTKIHEHDADNQPAQSQPNTSTHNANTPKPAPAPATQAPVTNTSSASPTYSVADEIAKLKKLLDSGAITKEEYDAQKKKIGLGV